MSAELKPCPFCGGCADVEQRGTSRYSCIVACENCGCRHESSDEGDNSGDSWNERATPAAAASLTITVASDEQLLKLFQQAEPGVEVAPSKDVLDAVEGLPITNVMKNNLLKCIYPELA